MDGDHMWTDAQMKQPSEIISSGLTGGGGMGRGGGRAVAEWVGAVVDTAQRVAEEAAGNNPTSMNLCPNWERARTVSKCDWIFRV